MAVNRHAQTLMALISVHVEMGTVFAAMGETVMVCVMLDYQLTSSPMLYSKLV